MNNQNSSQTITIPTGNYNKVRVDGAVEQVALLTDGTGDYSANGVFSCGTFSDFMPTVGNLYTITATHVASGERQELPGINCFHSGGTSQFQYKKPTA